LKKLAVVVLVLAAVFGLLQLVRPAIPSKPATAEVEASAEVRRVLEKSCYSCHSDEVRLAWFDQVVPAYWLVRQDVLTARRHLNFSTLGTKPAAAQRAALFEAVNMIQLGAMPLPQFRAVHPEAKVTAEDLAALKNYLQPWGTLPTQAAAVQAPVTATRPETVQAEPNGVAFDPSFATWKPISTTDRGDNNTFRIILGNDVAVQAIASGNLKPWPDGVRMAKIAWQQELGADGLLHPGAFVQVELMVKDHALYKDTEGWGWGRWRGLDLKPYGTDASFVEECTTCHKPMRGNDYVYTLPMTSATAVGAEVVNSRAPTLPASLPYQPLGWGAITMYVDPQRHSTAMLYGNDAAIQAVRSGAARYPAGAVLALVTWAQRDDPHWFGARIPDVPLSVEFVQVAAAGETNVYRRFAGSGMVEDHPAAQVVVQRTQFLENLAPARLP
jgi:mono/diheme cytochrome c family protein